MQFQIIPVKNVQRSFKIKRTDFWVLQIIDKTPYFFHYQGKGMVFLLQSVNSQRTISVVDCAIRESESQENDPTAIFRTGNGGYFERRTNRIHQGQNRMSTGNEKDSCWNCFS